MLCGKMSKQFYFTIKLHRMGNVELGDVFRGYHGKRNSNACRLQYYTNIGFEANLAFLAFDKNTTHSCRRTLTELRALAVKSANSDNN